MIHTSHYIFQIPLLFPHDCPGTYDLSQALVSGSDLADILGAVRCGRGRLSLLLPTLSTAAFTQDVRVALDHQSKTHMHHDGSYEHPGSR